MVSVKSDDWRCQTEQETWLTRVLLFLVGPARAGPTKDRAQNFHVVFASSVRPTFGIGPALPLLAWK